MYEPFYNKNKGAWYVWEASATHKDKRRVIRLGKDKDAAMQEWHRRQSQTEPVTKDSTVEVVVDRFLAWSDRHRSETTTKWYRGFLTPFVETFGKLPVSKLTPAIVEDWFDKHYGTCSDTGRNGAVRAVVRPFNWAVKRGALDRNPIRGVERPAAVPRDVYIQPEQWKRLTGLAKGELLDILTVLRQTGCRPHEARTVEARHVDRAMQAWVFEVAESKGKRVRRVVPLTDTAWGMTQRLMLQHPTGPLFRNTKGEPWTKDALSRAMQKLSKRAGIKATPYALRHSFATDALVNGVDPVTVSHIVGHKGLSMIQRVYAHVSYRREHIQASLRKAVGG